jgi:hypothetical protein
MDLGPGGSNSMLSGLKLGFEGFDDDVSKESTDLTVDSFTDIAGILETIKTDVIVVIGNVIMCLMSHSPIIRVSW